MLSLIFNIKERVRELTRSYLAGEEGFEPSHAGIKIQCLNRLTTPQQRDLAGEEGFEPSHAGIKIQCLKPLDDSPTLSNHLKQRMNV